MTTKYILTIEVDDTQIFSGEYLSEESLLEEGLRKANHQIEEFKQMNDELQAILDEAEEDE
jgi:hypothetical protein